MTARPPKDVDAVGLVLNALDELSLDGPVAEQITQIRTRLAEPLRIAVAGRLKSGKSTIVNALLGQRIAPTDVGECTKIVTWFRYGTPERVEVRLRDGTTQDVHLAEDGTLPRQLGIPLQKVADMQVWLSNDTLRSFTLIDTPGLASTDEITAASTRKLLAADSTAAATAADALLFVLNAGVRADERDTMRTFNKAQGAIGSAVNSLAVLTKADRLDTDGDSWAAATMLAKKLAERLADDVSTVVPLIGLWAESAQTGSLTEQDAELVQKLAATDDAALSDVFISADRFLGLRVGTKPQRQRLLQLLGLPGVEHVVTQARGGINGAVAIREDLNRASGLTALGLEIDEAFRLRSAPLRAWRALDELTRVAYQRGVDRASRDALRDVIEQLRFDGTLHRVAELDSLSKCCSGEVDLPDELYDELRRQTLTPSNLARSAGPDAGRLQTVQAIRRWHAFALSANPRQARIARVMMRSYRLAMEDRP